MSHNYTYLPRVEAVDRNSLDTQMVFYNMDIAISSCCVQVLIRIRKIFITNTDCYRTYQTLTSASLGKITLISFIFFDGEIALVFILPKHLAVRHFQ